MYNFYNTDLAKIRKAEYEAGRRAGFIAGWTAAKNKAPNDVEAAYEQGQRIVKATQMKVLDTK